MHIKTHKKTFKSTLALPAIMGLFLTLGTCYGDLPGKVIIDNESTFDLAITAKVFVNDEQYYEHHTNQITAANVDRPLRTDGVLKQGTGGEDNIQINVIDSESTIEIPLDVKGTNKYTINENGNKVELSVSIVDADRDYDKNDQLTGYFYRVIIQGSEDTSINEQTIDTMYINNGYDEYGNLIPDERYRYGIGGAIDDVGYGAGRAIEDVGYGAGAAVQSVGNAVGNIL